MTEPNPLMALMLQSASFVGMSASVEVEIQPLPQQLAFGPGDVAILATANTPLEGDFTVLKCLDPAEYADQFPDWQDRLMGVGVGGFVDSWNSHVLCEAFGREDQELTIGWFSRVKLLPIAKYRYKEARSWLKKGWPDEIPDWVTKYHRKYSDALAVQAPDKVPRSVICPNCKSNEVELKVSRRVVYSGMAGQLTIDGKPRYITVTDPVIDDSHVSVLHCLSCDSTGDLEDDEWDLPGISS